jgi:hypothetical protein
VLFGLALGLLGGRMIWAGKEVQAGGKIVYVIHANGEVYSTPKKEDKISWVAPNPANPSQGFPVPVHFLNGSPCKDGALVTPNCQIADDAAGSYPYDCAAGPGNPPCRDPGIDPNSDLGPTILVPKLETRHDKPTDLNLNFTCRNKKIIAVDLAHPDSTIDSSQLYAANVVSGIAFEASKFKPTISIAPKNQGDPKLCDLPSPGYYAVCSVMPGTSGKIYEVEAKDATGDCKSSASIKAEITVQ